MFGTQKLVGVMENIPSCMEKKKQKTNNVKIDKSVIFHSYANFNC